ncbi:MAG: hypothetical protein U0836_16710 [Pirellulales bacterium]
MSSFLARVVGTVMVVALLLAAFGGIAWWQRTAPQAGVAGGGVWACSMHPQIRMGHPGK